MALASPPAIAFLLDPGPDLLHDQIPQADPAWTASIQERATTVTGPG
ncbi:MAG: hypothetical protein R3F43_06015 [bacterium]